MHLTLQLMIHLTMQWRVHLWISLCVLYILYRAEETELLTFQIRFGSRRSQVFTAVGWFISFLLKSQTDSLKKDPTRDVFQWNCLIFQNCFLRNMFGWWLLLNTIHFLCCVDLISKMLLLTLAILLLSLNIFKVNTMSHLWTAASGSPRQLVGFLLIKQAIRSKSS